MGSSVISMALADRDYKILYKNFDCHLAGDALLRFKYGAYGSSLIANQPNKDYDCIFIFFAECNIAKLLLAFVRLDLSLCSCQLNA